MTRRWISCGTGSLHILEAFPECCATRGGLLPGTAEAGYAGRTPAKCVDCGESTDYHVDSAFEKVRNTAPVESRGASLRQ